MVYTFVLILTLTTAGTLYGGKSIHSVQFASESACSSAAKAWIEQLPPEDKKMASALCVPIR